MKKVTVSFELDLPQSGKFQSPLKPADIPYFTQELSCALYNGLVNSINHRKRRIAAHAAKHSLPRPEGILEELDREEAMFSGIFNNFSVSGTLESGKSFTFTHTEPGYEEKIAIEEDEFQKKLDEQYEIHDDFEEKVS